jgi:hypothetical protein
LCAQCATSVEADEPRGTSNRVIAAPFINEARGAPMFPHLATI